MTAFDLNGIPQMSHNGGDMKFTESAHFGQIGSVEIESQKVHLWGKMKSKNDESMAGICLLLQRLFFNS